MDDNYKIAIYEAACEILAYDYDSHVRPDYSGRGMYGSTTPAIVSDAPEALIGWAIAAAMIDAHDDDYSVSAIEDAKQLIPMRSDSMGRSSIVYY